MKNIILPLLLVSGLISAQPDQWWHYGTNNRSNQASPQSLTNGGCLNTAEGVACVSNSAGNFLFATDGVTVYNSLCLTMANGTALNGGTSSSQSAIIVKAPGSTTNYYIFTVAENYNPAGICYSIVDMTLGAGLGAVTTKNASLLPGPVNEKITAVQHCNGTDFWIIAKKAVTNEFYCWLLTSSGVSAPIISSSGYAAPLSPSQTGYGYLKANTNGTKLAAAYYGASGQTAGNRVELYDFNNSTGIISNAISLGNVNSVYGVEFSLSGRFLYASTNPGFLYQWDLCSLPYSRTLVANPGAFFGSLQLNRYNQIVIVRGTQTQVSAIMFADLPSPACTFNLNYATPTGASKFGLPNFVPAFIREPLEITAVQNGCDQYSFSVNAENTCVSENVVSYLWDFGDGSASTLINPTHGYSLPGTYNVTLTVSYNCRSEIVTTTVNASASAVTVITMN